MNALVLLMLAAALAAEEPPARPLTFDEAVSLAGAHARTAAGSPELPGDGLLRLPSVRIETTGNLSRTLDLFSEGPFEVRYATSVVAFDYPLWDGGAAAARIDALRARLRRSDAGRIDDARFARLVDAFGELYLVERQQEIARAFYERSATEAERTATLLASGDISNLTAVERRETFLAFSSRLLELEARRVDAASKVRMLTGLEIDPRPLLDPDAGGVPDLDPESLRDDVVDAMTVAVDESRARLREAGASSGFRAMLSGYAGAGAAESQFRDIRSDGSFGIYGLRVHLSYPLFRGSSAIALAEARADLERNLRARDAALEAARIRAAEYRLREETARRRIELLAQSVAAAREREESLARLVSAGVRQESDLLQAQAERMRREADLLAARIERWKAIRLLSRMVRAAATAVETDQP